MVQLLNISVDGIQYSLPLSDVHSVIRIMEITPVTSPERGQAGTINHHGTILPVYSMRALSGFPDRPPRLSDMLVIARAGEQTIALWVDETRGVTDLPPHNSPDRDVARDAPTLPGIRISDAGILIADLPRFLASVPDEVPGIPCAGPAESSKDLWDGDAAEVQTILSERARKMLQPEAREVPAAQAEILRFQLAYRKFAIAMDYVREVILTGEITPVPGTPDFIRGICAARGQIISLIDLRALFRIPEKGLTDLNRVIVITDGSLTFGILADTIHGVGTIALDQITPIGQNELPGCRKYVRGVSDNSLVVLDAAAILADPGMIVDDA